MIHCFPTCQLIDYTCRHIYNPLPNIRPTSPSNQARNHTKSTQTLPRNPNPPGTAQHRTIGAVPRPRTVKHHTDLAPPPWHSRDSRGPTESAGARRVGTRKREIERRRDGSRVPSGITLEAGGGGEDEEEGEREEVERRAASPNRHGRPARGGSELGGGREGKGGLVPAFGGRERPSGEWWRPVHSALALIRASVTDKVHSAPVVGAVSRTCANSFLYIQCAMFFFRRTTEALS